MPKTNLKCMALGFWLCVHTALPFAEPAQDLPVLLQTLVQNHPTIQSKRHELASAQQGVTVAARQFWPTPYVNTSNGPKNFSGKDRSITTGLSLPLYTGGQLSADLEGAGLREQAAHATVEAAVRELSFQFLDLYRAWWLHSAQVRVLESSLSEMSQLNDMMQRRLGSGVSAAVDALQAQTQWVRMQEDLAQAKRQRDQDLAQMSALAGASLHPVFVPLESVAPVSALNFSDLQERTLDQHPQIFLAKAEHSLALVGLKKVKASLQPSVSLRYERQYGSHLGTLDAGTRLYITSQLQWGAGLASLPLADQAAAQAAAANDQVQATRKQLRDQTLKIWHDEQLALQQSEALQKQLIAQKELVQAGVRLYQAGRRSWQDLLYLIREAYQLQLQIAEAESGMLVSRLRLQLLADVLPGFSAASFR